MMSGHMTASWFCSLNFKNLQRFSFSDFFYERVFYSEGQEVDQTTNQTTFWDKSSCGSDVMSRPRGVHGACCVFTVNVRIYLRFHGNEETTTTETNLQKEDVRTTQKIDLHEKFIHNMKWKCLCFYSVKETRSRKRKSNKQNWFLLTVTLIL